MAVSAEAPTYSRGPSGPTGSPAAAQALLKMQCSAGACCSPTRMPMLPTCGQAGFHYEGPGTRIQSSSPPTTWANHTK
jgi:hypothetical protein